MDGSPFGRGRSLVGASITKCVDDGREEMPWLGNRRMAMRWSDRVSELPAMPAASPTTLMAWTEACGTCSHAASWIGEFHSTSSAPAAAFGSHTARGRWKWTPRRLPSGTRSVRCTPLLSNVVAVDASRARLSTSAPAVPMLTTWSVGKIESAARVARWARAGPIPQVNRATSCPCRPRTVLGAMRRVRPSAPSNGRVSERAPTSRYARPAVAVGRTGSRPAGLDVCDSPSP